MIVIHENNTDSHHLMRALFRQGVGLVVSLEIVRPRLSRAEVVISQGEGPLNHHGSSS